MIAPDRQATCTSPSCGVPLDAAWHVAQHPAAGRRVACVHRAGRMWRAVRAWLLVAWLLMAAGAYLAHMIAAVWRP
jgi:hypothetical protein